MPEYREGSGEEDMINCMGCGTLLKVIGEDETSFGESGEDCYTYTEPCPICQPTAVPSTAPGVEEERREL